MQNIIYIIVLMYIDIAVAREWIHTVWRLHTTYINLPF